MQAKMLAMVNTRYAGFLSITSASRPMRLPTVIFLPVEVGGVCGSVRQYAAISTDVPLASRNGVEVASPPILPMIRPMTTQPMVANMRMNGNSPPASVSCRSVSELVSPIVGKKSRQYASIIA